MKYAHTSYEGKKKKVRLKLFIQDFFFILKKGKSKLNRNEKLIGRCFLFSVT